MQATKPADGAKTAVKLSQLSLHPHGSTDPAHDELQQSATTYCCSLGEMATTPHLVDILGRVGQKHRLQNCALVSRSWSKAAVEATDIIISTNSGLEEDSVLSMCQWLRQHGRTLNKLQVVLPHAEEPLVEARNQQFIQGLAAATNVTSLSLSCPGVFNWIVPELASLQSLQQLELVSRQPDIIDARLYIPEPGVAFLQQLISLTPQAWRTLHSDWQLHTHAAVPAVCVGPHAAALGEY